MTGEGAFPTICRQCDMRCGLLVELTGARLSRITGLKTHPQNRGRLCPKGPAAIDTVYHPERLLRPLKKTASGAFREIPLEQAMQEIAARLAEIRDRHGARAIACWQGEALGFGQQEHYARRFMHALGSPNFLSCNSVCYVARYLAYKLVQGYWNPCPDFRNARLILLWGANPPVSHFTFMAAIEEALQRGARLIVIDPRKTEIARKAHVHLMPWPGTDGAIAWGWIRHLLDSGRYDRDLAEKRSMGFEDLAFYAQAFTPERVARETGLDRHRIQTCARMIADCLPRVAGYVGVALEHQDNGVDTCRSIACLGGLCGAVDAPGGDPWPEGLELNRLDLYRELPLMDRQPVGAQAYPVLYDLYHEPHAMTGIDAMLGEGPYPLRALLVAGGNPANTNPNSAKTTRALANLDLLVVRDLFLTETAQLAHYVLPAASFLERSELHVYSHYQWLSLSRKLLDIPGVVDEYSFWRGLAHLLGFGERYFPWESEAEVNRWLLEPTGLTLSQLEEHPEGLRYKPVRYHKQADQPLPTPSGKFEFQLALFGELRLLRPAAVQGAARPACPLRALPLRPDHGGPKEGVPALPVPQYCALPQAAPGSGGGDPPGGCGPAGAPGSTAAQAELGGGADAGQGPDRGGGRDPPRGPAGHPRLGKGGQCEPSHPRHGNRPHQRLSPADFRAGAGYGGRDGQERRMAVTRRLSFGRPGFRSQPLEFPRLTSYVRVNIMPMATEHIRIRNE